MTAAPQNFMRIRVRDEDLKDPMQLLALEYDMPRSRLAFTKLSQWMRELGPKS
jgi:hypothetical protein